MTTDDPTAALLIRSAEHWFLDAAIFAREGDHEHATQAAKSGIAVLEAHKPKALPE